MGGRPSNCILSGNLFRATQKLGLPLDAIRRKISDAYTEERMGIHEASLKHGAKTALPVTDGARRILKAMGR